MLTREALFHGDLLHARRVRCRAPRGGTGAIEYSESDTVVLPVRGVFTKHDSPGRDILADPTQAVFFAKGRPYRVSHPSAGGDECLVLRFAPDVLREALVDAAAVDHLRDRRLRRHASLPTTALAVRDILLRRLAARAADGLGVEEAGLALLRAVAEHARIDPFRPLRDPARARTRRRRRMQTDAVRLRILEAPADSAALRELARLVHTTPYHLARVFRTEVGVSIHQHRLRVRLARALELLLDTDEDVTRIALDLGFSSHSHFSAAFRRMTGVRPRDLRHRADAAILRKLRTILTAEPRATP